jgi:hypothetical protein
MKKLVIVLLTVMATTLSVSAQEKSELSMIRDILKKEKKDLVKEYMAIDESKSAKFWEVYDKYSADRAVLAEQRLKALKTYGEKYETLTDAESDGIVKAYLKNDKANVNLQKKYYKKFKKAVGSTKAAQFLQMENYFQTVIRSEIQEAIPFIGEIERKRG